MAYMSDPLLRVAKWGFIVHISFLALVLLLPLFGVTWTGLFNAFAGIAALAGAVFTIGFLRLGQLFRLRLLPVMSVLLVIIALVLGVFIGLGLYQNLLESKFLIRALVIGGALLIFTLNGILYILFGIGLLPLRHEFGRIAQIAGILDIVGGGMLVVPFVLAILLMYPAGLAIPLGYLALAAITAGMILEGIVIFKAAGRAVL